MDYLACILYNTLQMLNYFRGHWADCFSTPGIIFRARFEDRFLVLFCFQIGNYRRLKFKWALDRLGSAQNELFGRLKVDCLLYCLMAKLKKVKCLSHLIFDFKFDLNVKISLHNLLKVSLKVFCHCIRDMFVFWWFCK